MAGSAAHDDVAQKQPQLIFVRGRFEARFPDGACARAAARDARATGFVVDVSDESPTSWLMTGRRKDAFPADEQGRYASRLSAIAIQYGGVFSRFVDESQAVQPAPDGDSLHSAGSGVL